jgi:hypothetical protein
MNKMSKKAIDAFDYGLRQLRFFGLDFEKTVRAIQGIPFYLKNLDLLQQQAAAAGQTFPQKSFLLCLGDRFEGAGSLDEHYFYQDWYVANRIFLNRPQRHVDIGSRIDGFVTHVASFREIEVFDIRPLAIDIPNIHFRQVDIMEPPQDIDGYCDSISSLHALEHFGLGRYGDPVNYSGYLIGLENIDRLLRPGGKLYLSVPIGEQRMEYNAHRVFSVKTVLDLLERKYRLDGFSYIDDQKRFFPDVELSPGELASSFGCHWGCGLFEATKNG